MCVSDKIIRTGWDVRGLVVVQFIPLRYAPYDFHIIPRPTFHFCAMCLRRYTELTVGYAESHDQALVGDQVMG